MKKSILLFAVALGLFTACDPNKEEKDFDVTNITADQLLANATFEQCAAVLDEDGNIIDYTPSETGNYIKYNVPGVNALSIFTLNADGSEKNLQNAITESFTHTGGGIFILKPRRNSDPHQIAYFRYTNQNGESVVASKEFTVDVPADIPYELKLLASDDYGEKIWKWDPSVSGSGAVWGNMGYKAGDGASVGMSGNGQWWGVVSNDSPDDGAGFAQQLNHSKDGKAWGDGDLDAYMVISEEGTITCYTKDGKEIRKGQFKIENYNPDATWKVADLTTESILWPWVINSGAKTPSECGWGSGSYEVVYLTPTQMTLVYPGKDAAAAAAADPTNENAGSWSEATFWHFKSESDLLGMVSGYAKEKSWTWDTSITGVVWGNMGYCGGDGKNVGTGGEGQWWGITANDSDDGAGFNQQLQHSPGGVNHGDGDLNAYMTFDKDGMLTSYAADGSVIRKGTYSLTATSSKEIKDVTDEFGEDKANQLKAWKTADLKTDALLWPCIINSGAKMPSEVEYGTGAYEVLYLTSDKMTLCYPSEGALYNYGGWSEATFWHFKAKE
ncbi:MAG: hypothetical protein IJV17_05840 [Prevotella sp.]|nr:hypothetical protein [Prevotella sp.]